MSVANGFGGTFGKGIALAGLFILAVAWWTASNSAQDSACVVKGSQISPSAVSKFIEAPQGLLERYSAGGGGLSAEVRDFVVTDPKTLDPITALISKSNEAQKSAIATGLSLAASLCQKTQPDFSVAVLRVVTLLKEATGSVASDSQVPATAGGLRSATAGNAAPATPGGTATACVSAGSQASSETIRKFLETPDALLNKYRSGGGGLTAEVRDLVVTDSKTLDPIIALISKANVTQKTAIGAGLGLAAALCQKTQPDLAAAIQRAVAELKDSNVTLAFLSSTKDPITAAVGSFGAFGVNGAPRGAVGTGNLVIGNAPSTFFGVNTGTTTAISLGSSGGASSFGASISPSGRRR